MKRKWYAAVVLVIFLALMAQSAFAGGSGESSSSDGPIVFRFALQNGQNHPLSMGI